MSEPLLHELRAAKPVAPAALRERVRTLSVQSRHGSPFSPGSACSTGADSCSWRRRRWPSRSSPRE